MSQPTYQYHDRTPYNRASQSPPLLQYQITSSPQPLPSHFIHFSPVYPPSPYRPLLPVFSTTSPAVCGPYRLYTSVRHPLSSPTPLQAPLVTVLVHRQSGPVRCSTSASKHRSPSTGPSRRSAPQIPAHTLPTACRDFVSPCSPPRDDNQFRPSLPPTSRHLRHAAPPDYTATLSGREFCSSTPSSSATTPSHVLATQFTSTNAALTTELRLFRDSVDKLTGVLTNNATDQMQMMTR